MAGINTIYFSKKPPETYQDSLDLTLELQLDEEISSVVVGLTSPNDTLVFGMLNHTPKQIFFQVTGGNEGTTYGVRVDITTSYGRVVPVTVAILVSSQVGTEYSVISHGGVQTLVDQIVAGESAVGNAVFSLPVDYPLAGGYVLWELLDADGTVYSNGNAFEVIGTNTSASLRVEARAIIVVPSEVPTNLLDQKFQIRWTLRVPDREPVYTHESLKVLGRVSTPQGVEDAIEMVGDIATLNIVLPAFYDHVGMELYQLSGSSKVLSLTEASDRHRVPEGYHCSVRVDTTNIPVALHPYIVIWKYWNDANPYNVQTESGRLFVLNASLLAATSDLKSMINRSKASIGGHQDILFTIPSLLVFLRQGRDSFNGAYGVLTSFDMTDATSAIRQYWLYFSAIDALRSQFLAEGEKAFNFSGQAIQLDVDRTGYYESAASAIQSRMDNECKPFKQNLIKKGIVTGTGNLDSIAMRRGAIGSVGISVSPASNFGRFMGKLGSSLR